ncbi:MAG TPA: toll/interleukin-1 receptor domain-containing protein [Humibacillus xanthopallidus]|nr:toll/interleukin-1 receptor domain-containing protein [Humibacillus xanthopallidus]
MSHDVFICHSSIDRAIANAVCARLEEKKIRCWIAPRDVIPGREFAESIIEAIHASKLTILVFSASSNGSQHVHKEIERSVSAGIPILPFRVEDVTPSPALEYFISDAHWLDALSPPLEQHLDHLVGTVQLLLDRSEPGGGIVGEDTAAAMDGSTGATRAAVTTAPPPPTAPEPAERVASPPAPGPRRIALWVGLAAALLAVVVVAALLLTRGGGAPAGTAGPTTPPTATSQSAAKPFSDEFTGAVDPSWTWLNEDPAKWKVTDKGRLEIVGQQPPPFRNVLLRTAPTGSYSVRLDLTFPAKGSGFAGLVFTGTDLNTRVQFGWTEKALVNTTYKDGDLATDSEMMTADLPVKPGGEARLLIEVENGLYVAKIYDPTYDTWFDLGTGRLDPALTKVGILTYAKGTPGLTASFDQFQIFF